MPNSFSNKPGFYDDGDTPATENSKKPSESNKPTQDTKKKQNDGPNDSGKRLAVFNEFNQHSE